MFNKSISTLTMTAMLLHSIFGCCTHHAHACDQGQADDKCHVAVAAIEQVVDEHPAHEHLDHTDCSSHNQAPAAGIDSSADHLPSSSALDEVVQHNVAGNETSSHDTSHGSNAPCRQECDGRDCSFTLASPVKPPSPNDVRLCFPLSAEKLAEISGADVEAFFPGDPEPPAGLISCRCRPMTQVWRL